MFNIFKKKKNKNIVQEIKEPSIEEKVYDRLTDLCLKINGCNSFHMKVKTKLGSRFLKYDSIKDFHSNYQILSFFENKFDKNYLFEIAFYKKISGDIFEEPIISYHIDIKPNLASNHKMTEGEIFNCILELEEIAEIENKKLNIYLETIKKLDEQHNKLVNNFKNRFNYGINKEN